MKSVSRSYEGLGAPDRTMMDYYQAEKRYNVQAKPDAGFVYCEDENEKQEDRL